MKKMKCKVCGERFHLLKENKYLATEPKSVIDALTTRERLLECFDCPLCGCQNVANQRLPEITIHIKEE